MGQQKHQNVKRIVEGIGTPRPVSQAQEGHCFYKDKRLVNTFETGIVTVSDVRVGQNRAVFNRLKVVVCPVFVCEESAGVFLDRCSETVARPGVRV
jgi:hypothetical protein